MSELAREERKGAALNQEAPVIVKVFREQARSYSREAQDCSAVRRRRPNMRIRNRIFRSAPNRLAAL